MVTLSTVTCGSEFAKEAKKIKGRIKEKKKKKEMKSENKDVG